MKGRRGFLLLEVMASIIVITGGLLFVMRVYSTAKGAIDRSRDLFRYSILMEEKIFDFEERGAIEEGADHGNFPGFKDYSWEVEATPLAPQGQSLSDVCAVRLGVNKYYLFTYIDKKMGI